ncbi:MAG TPA: hypothetical protein VHY20_07605, partial [Pirellulales bacterium]|nr:hypothetical protein [Pirellulales bacterium]
MLQLAGVFCIAGLAAAGCSKATEDKIHSDEVIKKVEALGGSAAREPDDPNGPVKAISLSEKKV